MPWGIAPAIRKCTETCGCKRRAVRYQNITLFTSILEMIRNNVHFDFNDTNHDDFRDGLFSSPPRFYTDSQNQHTLRFIRIHATDPRWEDGGKWSKLYLPVLRMSRYYTEAGYHGESGGSGEYVMILEGPARGEIHGWSWGWYDGFEATSFLEWKNDNWDPVSTSYFTTAEEEDPDN